MNAMSFPTKFANLRQDAMNNFDSSIIKNIPITESVRVRFNADFFNVLNHPGNPAIANGASILSTINSGTAAREIQLTLRLIW